MPHNYEHIIAEYLVELDRQGVRVSSHKSPIMKYFKWINDTGKDFLRLNISEATEYQIYLATMTDKSGKSHFSKVTVATMIERVSRFYEYLRKRKLIYANPFKEIRTVKRNRSLPRNILNESDMNLFLSHLKAFWKGANLNERRKLYRGHVIAEVMYSTGARINEVMKLTKADIDLSRGIITVHDDKTKKTRQCILNEYAGKVLELYIKQMRPYVLYDKSTRPDDHIFGAGQSLVIWFNGVLTKESERLGLPRVTSHHFRHAVGYHLLRAGCDIRYIKEILGHEEIGTTQVYTKVDKADLRTIIDTYHPRQLHEAK